MEAEGAVACCYAVGDAAAQRHPLGARRGCGEVVVPAEISLHGHAVDAHGTGAVEHVANQRPVHQVGTVVEGKSREVAEGRCHKPVVASCTADRRVGVPARKYRVVELCRGCQRVLGIVVVRAFIVEV